MNASKINNWSLIITEMMNDVLTNGVLQTLILTDYYNYLCKTVRFIIFPGKNQLYGFCVKPERFISRYKSFYCLCCNRAVTGYVIKIDSDTRYTRHT